MSLQSLPLELLFEIFSHAIPAQWLLSEDDRKNVFAMRLVNRTFNDVTVDCAYVRLDLVANYGKLHKLSPAVLSLLIRKRARLPVSTGALFTCISKLRSTLSDLGGRDSRLQRDTETYVDAFIDATFIFLGVQDTVDHLVAQDLPGEASFFGSNLKSHDLVFVTAVWHGDVELASFILCDNTLNRTGSALLVAFYLAAYKGNLEILRLVKKHEDIKVDELCGYYGNALMAAVAGGDPDAVRILIDWGADVNFFGTLCGRPLGLAAAFGHLDVVQLLLKMGADAIATDKLLQSALTIAAVKCTKKAIGHDANDILALLLDQDTEADSFQFEKCKALVAAAGCGNTLAVELLLKHGADPNAHVESMTPIERAACKSSNLEVVKLLLSHGASGKGIRSRTILDAALYYSNVEMAKFCIYEKGDFDPSSENARHSLGLAVTNIDLQIAEMLLESGVCLENGARLRFDDFVGQEEQEICAYLARIRDPTILNLLERRGIEFDDEILKAAMRVLNVTLLKRILFTEGTRNDTKLSQACERLNVPSFALNQHYPGLPDVLELLELDIELSTATISSAIKEAVKLRAMEAVRFLIEKCPGAQLCDYGGGFPTFEAVVIVMILHTADEQDRRQEAEALLRDEGYEIATIAGLLRAGQIQLSDTYKQPKLKFWFSIEFKSVPVMEFILKSYADELFPTYDHLLSIIDSVATLKVALTYYPKELCERIPEQDWTNESLLSAAQSRNYPVVEFLIGLGVRSNLRCCMVPPRNNHTDALPMYAYQSQSFVSPIFVNETMLRLLLAQTPTSHTPEEVAEDLKEAVEHTLITHLQILAAKGANVNTPIEHWGSALALALHRGKEDIVRFLLHWGADAALSLEQLREAEPPEKVGLWRDVGFQYKLMQEALSRQRKGQSGCTT